MLDSEKKKNITRLVRSEIKWSSAHSCCTEDSWWEKAAGHGGWGSVGVEGGAANLQQAVTAAPQPRGRRLWDHGLRLFRGGLHNTHNHTHVNRLDSGTNVCFQNERHSQFTQKHSGAYRYI